MIWIFNLLAFVGLFVFSACSDQMALSPAPNSASTERGRSIVDGDIASSRFFPSAMRIRTKLESGSAVKIGKRVGITSAHAFIEKAEDALKKPGPITVTMDGTDASAEYIKKYKIQKLYLHPGYIKYLTMDDETLDKMSPEEFGRKYLDIAIFVTDSTEPELPGETVAVDFKPVRKADPVGVTGFGCAVNRGPVVEDLRYALKEVSRILGNQYLLPPENYLSELKSKVCEGDSGGGVYRLDKNAEGKFKSGDLVGISWGAFKDDWLIMGVSNDWTEQVISILKKAGYIP